MGELEVQATAMAWDWDVNDIDVEDDNRKLWIPVMAQTLQLVRAEWAMRLMLGFHCMGRAQDRLERGEWEATNVCGGLGYKHMGEIHVSYIVFN